MTRHSHSGTMPERKSVRRKLRQTSAPGGRRHPPKGPSLSLASSLPTRAVQSTADLGCTSISHGRTLRAAFFTGMSPQSVLGDRRNVRAHKTRDTFRCTGRWVVVFDRLNRKTLLICSAWSRWPCGHSFAPDGRDTCDCPAALFRRTHRAATRNTFEKAGS